MKIYLDVCLNRPFDDHVENPVRWLMEVRFLQQFESGIGNYTKEREQWLKDLNVKSAVEEIKGRRKAK